MFESIKNYNDLKALFNTSDKVFDIYGYLRCCSAYGEGEHLIITPSIEASQKVFVKFQQENKIGSFIRNGSTFKISIGVEKILIYDINHLQTHHLDGLRFKSINFMEWYYGKKINNWYKFR